ncbi:MAG: LysE family translocator [Bacteroidetes bacterium]|nr:MAG: LysE family translocator [Bacteroidota bacterium]REK00359.1 MAG: LysE family translocator [Bacteroidota bacterium]REK35478.1 MAG: LysE family translocator [Bacteroidota bacterium]REK46838.1 MAG: LysE family translocator [Bacteroidota bacterium]
MLEATISGITFGLILAVMLGPVFFALIQTSLHEGFSAGLHLAFGVFLSDSIMILICLIFASSVNLLEEHPVITGWSGGLVLIGFGIFNFFKKIKVSEVDDDKRTVHARFVAEGFLLNILNPAVILFWLSVVGIVSLKDHYTSLHTTVFFSSVMITVLSTDLLKVIVAQRIKKILNKKAIHIINRMVGIALIAFGLSMIVKVI